MPDIYLQLNGQQAGPYPIAQIHQFLAEGTVTTETPAWYQGLSEWSTLSKVMAAFPAEGIPPAFPPPPPPAPAKKGMSGCVVAAIVLGLIGFAGIFFIAVLAGIALGPIQKGIEKAKENMEMQQARTIALLMFTYSLDHGGAYPDGATSTEVFQKLIDGKYASDPAIFYFAMAGKTKPTSDKLTAENVCFDATSGVNSDSPEDLPVVFSTGYEMTYSAGASATHDEGIKTAVPGIAVAYKDNRARFLVALPEGSLPQIIPTTFDPGTKTYRQLKP